MGQTKKIGLGGGCHWCTEAVFQALKGVEQVEQGYISSIGEADSLSEAVIVHYNANIISIENLIEIHVHTHRATSNHSFRDKYRSAVYYFSKEDAKAAEKALKKVQKDFSEDLITTILPFREFEPSRESIQDYYDKNPEAPFCKRYIDPKLELLRERFSESYKDSKYS